MHGNLEFDAGKRALRALRDQQTNARTQGSRQAPSPSFVLAFDFGGTKMAIATASLDKHILARTEISTVACRDGHTALTKAICAGVNLVEQTQKGTGGCLVGIGVSTMGITRDDRVDMAPNVPGWADLRIKASMREYFPNVPILIDNDVKAAALAELRSGGLRGTDAGLYVNLGTGIAVAFTLKEKVIRGYNGAAGEIAYNMRHAHEEQGVRQDVAPLEEFAGGRAIGERATRHFGRAMTAADVFDLARTDDVARQFVDETLREIAFQLTNLIIAWDPEKVVFGGGLMGAADIILPVFEDYVQRFVPFPPVLALAHYRRDSGLYGAMELALCGLRDDEVGHP
jgi:glucokinase